MFYMCIDNNKFLENDKKNGHFDTNNNSTTIHVGGTVLQYSYFSVIS